MKRFLCLIPLLCVLALPPIVTSCKNPGRASYTTLAASEKGVSQTYEAYLDSVIKGQVRTNEVPTVSRSFEAFQASMRAAIDQASGNTNAPITGELATAAANIIAAIQKAKEASPPKFSPLPPPTPQL